jgi:3-methyl-2-oxobutanoate hydroxymethyltransferase
LVTEAVAVPTIGIGAGRDCDGQVLVIHDMLGLFDRFTPKFVKQYAHLSETVAEAIAAYKRDVQAGRFPEARHSFSMKSDELDKLRP